MVWQRPFLAITSARRVHFFNTQPAAMCFSGLLNKLSLQSTFWFSGKTALCVFHVPSYTCTSSASSSRRLSIHAPSQMHWICKWPQALSKLLVWTSQ